MIPVMIVEDEFLVRAGLRTSIDWEKEGFVIVAEAQNGLEALEMYQKYKPYIVVTDIRLPQMDGLQMMKEIRKLSTDVSFIIISAYDDFQYAKEAISIGVVDYFLKGNMDVGEFLKSLQKLRAEKYFTGKEKHTLRQCSIKEFYLSKSPAGIAPGDWENVPDRFYLLFFRPRNTNQQMLEAMGEDYFIQWNVKYIRLGSEKGSWFLLSLNEGGPDELIEHLYQMFGRYVDEEIRIYRSEKLAEYPNMKEAVYHVLLSYERGGHMMGGHVGRNDGKTDYQALKNIEKDLAERLKFQKYEEGLELLGQMRRKVIELGLPAALFKGIYRIVGVLGECDEELVASGIYENLMESLDITYIFETLRSLILNLKGKREEDGNIYILKVKEYIENHYKDTIRIKDLSEYIHVSPNYLGKLFYLNTGEHLRDYINSVKLEKSRELLLSKKYQVSEVAVMVGIEDQRYFSKLFKKYYGVSPKEFGK